MINNKKVLAFIPARGGSKGIKNKNIYEIHNKPLIAYSIDAARNSKYVDDIIVSTDSENIKSVALEYGADVPFLRPSKLATDTATTLDAVLHCVNYLKETGKEYDYFLLLQPTSPLRSVDDIDAALEKFVACGEKGLASISEVVDHPVLIRKTVDGESMEKLLPLNSTVRRQDMPNFYRINGSIYINLIENINGQTSFNDNTVYYLMEKSHSVDIDDYADIELVKYYMHVEENR